MLDWRRLVLLPVLAVGLGLSLSAPVAAQKTLKMQASWPTSLIHCENSAKNPVFKEICDSQREFPPISMPAKRFYHPAYGLAAEYYWDRKQSSPDVETGPRHVRPRYQVLER